MVKEPTIIKTEQLAWVNSSNKIKPTAIVLHWWRVPTWLGGINYLIWGLRRRKLSVQFAVLKNGEIYQLVDDPTIYCRHAKCANESSIGIELQGFGAKDLARQLTQFQSTIKLVAYLCDKYKISVNFDIKNNPLRFYGITSHKNVDQYCQIKRLLKKNDVNDEYLRRVILEISLELSK